MRIPALFFVLGYTVFIPTNPAPQGESQTSVWRRNRWPWPCGHPGAEYRPLRAEAVRQPPAPQRTVHKGMVDDSNALLFREGYFCQQFPGFIRGKNPAGFFAKLHNKHLRPQCNKKVGQEQQPCSCRGGRSMAVADSFIAPSPFPAFPVPPAWFYQRHGHRYPVWYWAGSDQAVLQRCGHPRPGQ